MSQATPRGYSDVAAALRFTDRSRARCRLLRRDPHVDGGFKDRQRQRTVVQHGIMETAKVKARSKRALSFFPQREDLLFADLIGCGLAWPDEISVDLRLGKATIELGVIDQVFDRLVPRPAETMHAGVDDEPTRAMGFKRETAEPRVRICVQAELFAEALGVKPPTFAVAGVSEGTAQFRDPRKFLRSSDLQMMARHRLV